MAKVGKSIGWKIQERSGHLTVAHATRKIRIWLAHMFGELRVMLAESSILFLYVRNATRERINLMSTKNFLS
ncbi:MAG: hypothetical protein U0K42_06430 [Bacteroidales bacterium]|nr:hypothetical protein [Bacteroidales bacterium]